MGEEIGQLRVLGTAGLGNKIVHHVQRALVVYDHALQKQAVKFGTVCSSQPRHLVGRQHAGHDRDVAGIGRNGRRRLVAVMGVPARAAMGAVSGVMIAMARMVMMARMAMVRRVIAVMIMS